MIQPNDKILVCVSGGKDSLSLLHCMHEYQQACNRRPELPSFEFGAVTVDPAFELRFRNHNLRVIRPLVFVREKVTRTFAEMAGLPIIPENCPACFQMPKERMRIKRVLTEYESIFPYLYSSLQAAMMPLLSRNAALGLSGFEDARLAIQNDRAATPEEDGDDTDCPRRTSCADGQCKDSSSIDH
ncbi:unnamed protein product [Dibothriocephalus latus]|uniref:tRNA(Ile)-lysidine/2-thiocytidine synthase N-terminal domain-containing protein n=1 Tax=Dibothriocephalus latus TaxID=60516 RepID=A0A3P6TK86_DIBLA|nr:unnamed protein product [Dibothriocephalus latus]